MIDRPDNVNIFILYAAEDQPLKKELEGHLSFLQRLGHIDVWHEGQIQPGVEKEQVVAAYLDKAHIILLLISANFLAPDHYMQYEQELRRAYDRQQKGEVVIIPVILRHCVWQLDFLAGLNPLPAGGHPVRSTHWESVDKAFHEVTVALQQVAAEIKEATLAADTPEAEVAAPTPAAPQKSIKQDAVSHDRLLDELFEPLFSLTIEEASARFLQIAHRSLVANGALDAYFLKHSFAIAHERIQQYTRPPAIISRKSTGRRRIGPRNDKDEGEEYAYTLVRSQDTGALSGQVRVFVSAKTGLRTISGISL